MTEAVDTTIIVEAIAIIDRSLSRMSDRELISSDEVADLLLDLRTFLAAQTPTASVEAGAISA